MPSLANVPQQLSPPCCLWRHPGYHRADWTRIWKGSGRIRIAAPP